jgi:uncharacterized protein YheU (UPF0270 family)
MSPDDSDRFVEVPPERLSQETLRRLLEEFVTRDGTDYGRSEKTVDQKVDDVMRQLRQREVRIVFDTETQRVNVVTAKRA